MKKRIKVGLVLLVLGWALGLFIAIALGVNAIFGRDVPEYNDSHLLRSQVALADDLNAFSYYQSAASELVDIEAIDMLWDLLKAHDPYCAFLLLCDVSLQMNFR